MRYRRMLLQEAMRLYDDGFDTLADQTVTRFLGVDFGFEDRAKMRAVQMDVESRDRAATRQWFDGRDGGWTAPERLARRDKWNGMDFYHADADRGQNAAVVVPFPGRYGALTVVPKNNEPLSAHNSAEVVQDEPS